MRVIARRGLNHDVVVAIAMSPIVRAASWPVVLRQRGCRDARPRLGAMTVMIATLGSAQPVVVVSERG